MNPFNEEDFTKDLLKLLGLKDRSINLSLDNDLQKQENEIYLLKKFKTYSIMYIS